MANPQAAIDPAPITETRLRFGTNDDVPAIARLMRRANVVDRIPHIDERELGAVADRGQLLVLQLGTDEVAAAACVAPGRGLVFLVIDPEVATPDLEHRMIAVAGALCESDRRPSMQIAALRVRGRR
jgi:hypothetical protein